jgi:CheY-like chemotaxis protein
VDDDAEILEFTAGLFRMCGATVKAITGAPQALEVARQVSPHVVVTDIAMPGKDGYRLGDQLRHRGWRRCPSLL